MINFLHYQLLINYKVFHAQIDDPLLPNALEGELMP